MPIYEYNCRACSHRFDVLQKMSDEPIQVCPACQAHEAVRLVSAAGFQLKGTGWYATDFKQPSSPPVAEKKKTSQGDEKPKAVPDTTPASSTGQSEKG